MDTVSEQRLALVVPALAEKVRAAMLAFSLATGSSFRVVQGLRTYMAQDELYEQGRTTPGAIVTNARGGWSNHNFGMAVDCVPDVQGSFAYTPDWNTAHPDWHTMVSCLKEQGLAWGGDWHGAIKADVDHFQLGNVPATPTEQDRTLFAQGGLPAVWKAYGFGGVDIAAAAVTSPGLDAAELGVLLVLVDEATDLFGANRKYDRFVGTLWSLKGKLQRMLPAESGPVSIAASSGREASLRHLIAQEIIEDLAERGPISKALEGWQG